MIKIEDYIYDFLCDCYENSAGVFSIYDLEEVMGDNGSKDSVSEVLSVLLEDELIETVKISEATPDEQKALGYNPTDIYSGRITINDDFVVYRVMADK